MLLRLILNKELVSTLDIINVYRFYVKILLGEVDI
jgi:hypothetical protein